jgi:hypothetical protein
VGHGTRLVCGHGYALLHRLPKPQLSDAFQRISPTLREVELVFPQIEATKPAG